MGRHILKREQAITFVKETFATKLKQALNLIPVSSPIVVLDGTGINDDLNGIERPVSFPIKSLQDQRAVVVHSLAKWKRIRLKELELEPEEGILTDMRALRPDEDYSPIHSIYVDQWDWEKVILEKDRTLDYLKNTVTDIYKSILETEIIVEGWISENNSENNKKYTFTIELNKEEEFLFTVILPELIARGFI